MKGKTFLILLVAAGILAALSFFHFGDENRTGDIKMGDKLFTDLPVNDVVRVTIADAENRTTLIKGEKVWQVEERDGYPADFDELRDTLVKLSRLKMGRRFSGSPESLVRLSLIAPSNAETPGMGTQITLKDQSENILADLLLGQARETDGGGSGGQYVKKTDADTVFLVDGDFRFLKTAPAQWLRKEIIDINAEEVASIVCYAEDNQKPVFTLTRPEKGKAAQMTPLPPERSTDSAKIDQVFDALAPLTLDDVKPGKETPQEPQFALPRLVYHLYDGRQIFIFPDTDGSSYTLRVAAMDGEPQGETDAAEVSAAEDGEQRADDAVASETQTPAPKTARQLNEELGPWIFSVKKWQFDSFITRPESLLEAVKKEGDGNS